MKPAQDIKIKTSEDLRRVLDEISFKNSVLDFQWRFKFRDCMFPVALDQNTNSTVPGVAGWLVWAEFYRPDISNGDMGWGRGRDEIVLVGASESSVVKTAWVLVEMLVKHELMEGFRYKGIQIFNPHNTVHELMLPAQVKSLETNEKN